MRSPTTGEVPPAHYGFWTALTERSASVTRPWEDPRRGAVSARGPFSFRYKRHGGADGAGLEAEWRVVGSSPPGEPDQMGRLPNWQRRGNTLRLRFYPG
jgi:hypothetical protein